MHYQHAYSKPRLTRSSKGKVIAGVCDGLARHFDIDVSWMRFGWFLATILTFPVVPILYVLCIFLMPREGHQPRRGRRGRQAPRVEVPQFADQEEAMSHLHRQFDLMEAKIQRMEDHVTSKEYVLKRKFEDL